MKKTNKIIVALCIIFTILSLCVASYASNADAFDPRKLSATYGDTDGIKNLGNSIIGVVRTVGVVVAVVILLVLGIKYMMGSAEEKADYKKSMIPYIVGAVLIFASTTIVGIVYDMTNALNASQSAK